MVSITQIKVLRYEVIDLFWFSVFTCCGKKDHLVEQNYVSLFIVWDHTSVVQLYIYHVAGTWLNFL